MSCPGVIIADRSGPHEPEPNHRPPCRCAPQLDRILHRWDNREGPARGRGKGTHTCANTRLSHSPLLLTGTQPSRGKASTPLPRVPCSGQVTGDGRRRALGLILGSITPGGRPSRRHPRPQPTVKTARGDLTLAPNRPFVLDVGPRALVLVEEPRLSAPSLARALGTTLGSALGWRRCTGGRAVD